MAQDRQNQGAQVGQDHVGRVGIHPFLLPQHLLDQGYCLLRGGEFPVQQGRDVHTLQVEGDGHIPGRDTHIRIVHVPLVGSLEGKLALLQEDVLTVGNGVQLALIHISQLRHGVFLTGENEALLPLLVEEGVDAVNADLTVQPQAGIGAGIDLLGSDSGAKGDLRFALEGIQAEISVGFDTCRLIEVEVLEVDAIVGNGQNAFAAPQIKIGVDSGTVQGDIRHIRRQQKDAVCRLGLFVPVGQKGAEFLKSNRIQILDHITQLLRRNMQNGVTVGDPIIIALCS